MLAPSYLVAEEETAEVEQDDAQLEVDAAELEAAKQKAIARKKQQINGYQAITVAGQEIDATYLEETTGDKHGIVVFFHDKNQSFENPSVITPLRHALPEHGWSTVSFAMDYTFEDNILLSASLEPNDASTAEPAAQASETEQATSEEAPKDVVMAEDAASEKEEPSVLPPVSNEERIEAVLSFIEAKDYPRIIFVGHAQGGEIAANIMAPLDKSIEALLLINVDAFASHELFETIVKPTLDIYSENASNAVKMAVKQRKKVMKLSDKPNYSMRMLIGANTSLYGFEERLTKVIRSWLHKQFLAEKK